MEPIVYDAEAALERRIKEWPAQWLLGVAAKLQHAFDAGFELEDIGTEELIRVIEREAGSSVIAPADETPRLDAE